jgi:hypothetical protein
LWMTVAFSLASGQTPQGMPGAAMIVLSVTSAAVIKSAVVLASMI